MSQNGFKNASRSLQKSIKKRGQKITRKILEFGSQNGSKNHQKVKEGRTIFVSKTLSKYSFDFLSFLELFCLPLGFLWSPFWLPLAAFGLPFGAFWHPLASSGLPWGPPKDLIASGCGISPRSCRDSAELGSIPSQDLLQKTASIPSLAAFCHRTQVVHPVKTLRRLKWYILPHLIARFCRERAENPPRIRREPAV